ncbi:10827_t:CDS:1 [Racocetra fulgida]|uniref:10827_t:CDS:1 n=1 Tax=Racocetra fulgida TaxID=60492 RepID=A0A9N8WAT3_9GLOM|nr:10827_t:CDS:1 [Racocetra fulgida]
MNKVKNRQRIVIENNTLIKNIVNDQEKIEILEEKIKYISNIKLTEVVKTDLTSLKELSYNVEIPALEKKIEALKNYDELQSKFNTLFDTNKDLRETNFQNSKKINELNNKLSGKEKQIPFSNSKEDKKQKELFEKFIRNFREIETLQTGFSIKQKNKKHFVNKRTEIIIKKILNDFEIRKKTLEKEHEAGRLMRETNILCTKSDLAINEIATKYGKDVVQLEADVEYKVVKLKNDIESKINSDLEKHINFESKKLKLEKQIEELENNSDLKMLQTILNELSQENRNLRNLNHENSNYISKLNEQIIFSRSKKRNDENIKKMEHDIIASQKSAEEFKLINKQLQERLKKQIIFSRSKEKRNADSDEKFKNM